MTPSVASTSAASGAPAAGPTPNTLKTTKAAYMPSMTKSPCAKLTMFIMPQTSVRPEDNSAGFASRAPGQLPAIITCDRRLLGIRFSPDRDVIFAVLQLDDDGGGEH